MDENLAEIIGVMLGDGCLYKIKNSNKFQIRVTSHKEELNYVQYLKSLFRNYFDYTFSIENQKTSLSLRNTSVFVGECLISFGLTPGNKVNNKITIPKWIFSDRSFLKRTIRGLFDTDGCIYNKYAHYAQIQFKFGCLELTKSLHKAVRSIGFTPTTIQEDWCKIKMATRWKFYLSRQKEIDQFFSVIKPKNQKHVLRYNKIRKVGM
jgi:DNA-binding transcriptional regulator WhiA